MTHTITIPFDELKEVNDLLHIISFDETKPIGQVHLHSDGNVRRWSTTDRVRATRLIGGRDSETYSIGIPPALFRSGQLILDSHEDLKLTINDEANSLTLTNSRIHFTLPGLHDDFPDVDSKIPTAEQTGAEANIAAKDLYDLVETGMFPREAIDDTSEDDDPTFPHPFWLSIHEGRIGVGVHWPTLGMTDYEVTADDVSGTRSVMVNPYLLKSIIQVFDAPDVLTVKIPVSVDYPLSLESNGKTALLMPLQTRMCSAFHHVRGVLEEEFGYLAAVFHEDGTCRIARRGSEIMGELIQDHGTPVFRVYASLLDQCQPTEELLRELNELNEGSTFVRLFLKDGVVTAQSDLVAERMDRHELRTATERIANVARDVIPTLALVLGGRQFDDPFTKRLQKYRHTFVEAEVTPGHTMYLNGPNAVADWPFPGPIHVLTGSNPEGVEISDEVAADINRKIAVDVMAFDGRFVFATAHSAENVDPEPSLVAWNLDRQMALTISEKANRDAVLEINQETILLISTNGDVVETWNRR